MAGVKIYALATVRRQRWLTRQVAVVDGEVVRTVDVGSLQTVDLSDTAEVTA